MNILFKKLQQVSRAHNRNKGIFCKKIKKITAKKQSLESQRMNILLNKFQQSLESQTNIVLQKNYNNKTEFRIFIVPHLLFVTILCTYCSKHFRTCEHQKFISTVFQDNITAEKSDKIYDYILYYIL